MTKGNEMDIYGIAEKYGVEVIEKPNGHIQLKGQLLVNYYPNSKKRTAYVAGTTIGKKHVSSEQAVLMTQTAPKLPKKDGRKKHYRKEKSELLKVKNRCHWCDCLLNPETATLEHIIPLSRGGLDNKNNMALACLSCNQERGSDMPELVNI